MYTSSHSVKSTLKD